MSHTKTEIGYFLEANTKCFHSCFNPTQEEDLGQNYDRLLVNCKVYNFSMITLLNVSILPKPQYVFICRIF